MAINVVQRFRYQHELRAYRQAFVAALALSPAFDLLPALKDLPLDIIGPAGTLWHPQSAGLEPGRLVLAGDLGSGRRLALRQLAQRWAESDAGPLPALVSLPELDDGHSSPETLLGSWLLRLHPLLSQKLPPPLEPRRAALTEQLPSWGLLIEGWEDLPPTRRDLWRSVLLAAARLAPSTSIAIITPAKLPTWPGFATLMVCPPSATLRVTWIDQLVQPAQRARLHAALAPGSAPAPLGERLVELALLVWVGSHGELPAGRASLYDQALALLLASQHSSGVTPSDLQLLAAYDEPPPASVPGLLTHTASDQWVFTHPLARIYLAARQLVAEGRYDLLQALEPADRTELACFATSAAPNPAPVYAALWGNGRPTAEDLLTLARCLRERSLVNLAWPLRIIGALALLARDGPPAQREQAAALLPALIPQINQTFDLLAQGDEQVQHAIPRLLNLLPARLQAQCAARLVYAEQTPEALGWALADQLVTQPGNDDQVAAPAGAAAYARWIYVQALGSPVQRARLAQALDQQAITAFEHSSAGAERQARVASALVGDPNLPAVARIAGMSMLAHSHDPASQSIIEQACDDPQPEVQRAALAALARRAPGKAYTTLAQAALDPSMAWEIRLDAIRQLGAGLSDGTGALLEACARSDDLPLFGRLQSVEALSSNRDGWAHLDAIAHAADCHIQVRAAAAQALGKTGNREALLRLVPLLADPAPSPELAEGICAGLGRLADSAASAALLMLLERCAADLDLTLVVIEALGRLVSEAAVAELSRLLGAGALTRLQQAVARTNPQRTPEELIETQALPSRMLVRLTAALAASPIKADRPTTLNEFLFHEANRLREACAQALGMIGGQAARAALLAVLTEGASAGPTIEAIEALACINGPAHAQTLGTLLDNQQVNPLTRWLIVQHLREHPDGEAVMLRSLARREDDPFIRGALAEALGQRGASAALPLLRQMIDDQESGQHLRAQAILALGLLDDPTSEMVLIRLIRTQDEDPALRGLAAEHLPSQLSIEGRRFLRELLRRERPLAPIAAGALRTLGRIHDREATAIMLRYCQDDPPAVAQASLLALADVGDTGVAPALIRVAQNQNADATTRLQAIGTLLRLKDGDYWPLLRIALDNGPIPLRLQALEHLLDAHPADNDLLPLLSNQAWPLPLRLRLLDHCADAEAAETTLISILNNQADALQLRCLVAATLARRRSPVTVIQLARLAHAADTALELRLGCIAGLGAFDSAEAALALSQLAEGAAQPVIYRAAVQSLKTAAERTWNI